MRISGVLVFTRIWIMCLAPGLLSGCGDGGIGNQSKHSGVEPAGNQMSRLILTTSPFIEMQLRQMLGGTQSIQGIAVMRIPGANANGHFTELTYEAVKLIREADSLVYAGGNFDRKLRSQVEKAGLRDGNERELVLFKSSGESGSGPQHPWMNPDWGMAATEELGRWLGEHYSSTVPLIESNLPGMLDGLQKVIDEIRSNASLEQIDKSGRGVLCTHNSIHTFTGWLGIPVIDLTPFGDSGQITLAFSGRIRSLMASGEVSALVWDDQIQLLWLSQMAEKYNIPSILIITAEKKLPDGVTYPEVIMRNFKAFKSVYSN